MIIDGMKVNARLSMAIFLKHRIIVQLYSHYLCKDCCNMTIDNVNIDCQAISNVNKLKSYKKWIVAIWNELYQMNNKIQTPQDQTQTIKMKFDKNNNNNANDGNNNHENNHNENNADNNAHNGNENENVQHEHKQANNDNKENEEENKYSDASNRKTNRLTFEAQSDKDCYSRTGLHLDQIQELAREVNENPKNVFFTFLKLRKNMPVTEIALDYGFEYNRLRFVFYV